jgi:hypothetical protein
MGLVFRKSCRIKKIVAIHNQHKNSLNSFFQPNLRASACVSVSKSLAPNWKILLSYWYLKAHEGLNMKIRILKLTAESLVRLLQGKASEFNSTLPMDAEIFDVKMDLFSKQVSIVVRSESFEDVAEAMPIPEFNISKTANFKNKPSPISPVKAQVIPEFKSTIAKLPIPEPSRMASKMENEFSPEQRKLLNFTVKEDCVVVKPVMFLKAEWDDINEVVRSLGGRWIKGDIISYWEIPLQ